MVDPRDTMLNAARALHERDEYNPATCATCTDPTGMNPVAWPCPTATALGATGRSEWLTPAATTTPCPRVSGHCGPWRIGCSQDAGHDGPHDEERLTDTRTEPASRCASWGPGHTDDPSNDDYRCDLTQGHPDGHYNEVGDTW